MNVIKTKPSACYNLTHGPISSKGTDKTPSIKPTIFQKIARLAGIIFKALFSFFLYWTNPSLFSLGFVFGIVADEQCKKGIKNIKNVWKAQPWRICALGMAASFLSLPVTVGAGSCLWGAYLGSSLSRQAQKIISRQAKEQQVTI